MKKFSKILHRKTKENPIIETLKENIDFERKEVTQPALTLCNAAEEAIDYINYLEQEHIKIKKELIDRIASLEAQTKIMSETVKRLFDEIKDDDQRYH